MKDRRDLKREYNAILRWSRPDSTDGSTPPTKYFIESLTENETVLVANSKLTTARVLFEIIDEEAIKFIESKGVTAFRNLDLYTNHVELFKMLGLKKTNWIEQLAIDNNLSLYKLAKKSGVQSQTIYNIRNNDIDIDKVEITTLSKIAIAVNSDVSTLLKQYK